MPLSNRKCSNGLFDSTSNNSSSSAIASAAADEQLTFRPKSRSSLSQRSLGGAATPPNDEEFVSQDVSDALKEARQILTEGKARQNPHERLKFDTTTVQITKEGSRNDPVEITVTRSRILSQQNSEEEREDYGSYSDSDYPLPPMHKCSLGSSQSRSGSDEQLLPGHRKESAPPLGGSRHTSVRYRRKHDELWRKEEEEEETMRNAGGGGRHEAQLEVDFTEECRASTEGGGTHLVIKTWEARWTVQSFELLPEWLQDNEFLRTGHRPPLPSFAECFKSILSLHTETGNIWTHLLGCLAFFFLALWFLTRPHSHIQLQEKLIFSFFFIGAIVCLAMSFLFHTVSCHSHSIQRAFSKLDYAGISLLIVGSFVPWIYYGFYCRLEAKISYITMVSLLGLAAITISMWEKFGESRFRPFRAGIFVAMGLSGIVPATHFIITDGIRRLIDENAFYWLLVMAGLYLVGALLYATRTPERFFPGKFDLWFQSHQLFHLCVVCAAFAHYYGISEMAFMRLTDQFCEREADLAGMAKHEEL